MYIMYMNAHIYIYTYLYLGGPCDGRAKKFWEPKDRSMHIHIGISDRSRDRRNTPRLMETPLLLYVTTNKKSIFVYKFRPPLKLVTRKKKFYFLLPASGGSKFATGYRKSRGLARPLAPIGPRSGREKWPLKVCRKFSRVSSPVYSPCKVFCFRVWVFFVCRSGRQKWHLKVCRKFSRASSLVYFPCKVFVLYVWVFFRAEILKSRCSSIFSIQSHSREYFSDFCASRM